VIASASSLTIGLGHVKRIEDADVVVELPPCPEKQTEQQINAVALHSKTRLAVFAALLSYLPSAASYRMRLRVSGTHSGRLPRWSFV